MSANRPVIGITTQSLQAIDGIPVGLPSSVVMNERYVYAAAMAGGLPWLVPLLTDDLETLRGIYDRLDGILLPGGVDVNPEAFGETPHERLGRIDRARDHVEMQLTRWAAEDRKPVFGLCRGLQIMNVALGGSLYQDLEAQYPDAIKHDYFPNYGFERDHLAHEVTVASGSRLRHLVDLEHMPVNSMHHQGIKVLSPALVPSAFAPDGLIEAAEAPGDHFMVGVQWHPEVFEMTDPHTQHVFSEFIEASTRYRG